MYDRQLPAGALSGNAHYLGTPDLASWKSKQMIVSRCLHERGIQGADAVFIDDAPSEIQEMKSTCATIQVQPPRGMGHREIELLWRLLGPSQALEAPNGGGYGPPPPPSSGQAHRDAPWGDDNRHASPLGG